MATSSTYYLPKELVIKILLCLPVKYLLRCKLVCKLWLSIILDPDFIQTHLTISQKRPLVLTASEVYDMKGSSYQTVSIISNPFDDSVNLPVPSSYPAPASCNGLMCLSDPDIEECRNIYLWNPSTRQGKKLPRPIIRAHYAFLVCVGFHLDSISNDYKILRLVFSYPYEAAGESGARVRVELYSTKSDSWTEIQVDKVDTEFVGSFVHYDRHKRITSGPVIKRVLYINDSRGLISFQLNNRMLKLVPLPINYRINYELRRKKWEPKVFEFEGRAALILHGNNDESLSLWTLDDDDDEDEEDDDGRRTWTKKLNLEGDIMKNWTTIYLVLVNLLHGKIIKKSSCMTIKQKIPRYIESLVSVEGFSEL